MHFSFYFHTFLIFSALDASNVSNPEQVDYFDYDKEIKTVEDRIKEILDKLLVIEQNKAKYAEKLKALDEIQNEKRVAFLDAVTLYKMDELKNKEINPKLKEDAEQKSKEYTKARQEFDIFNNVSNADLVNAQNLREKLEKEEQELNHLIEKKAKFLLVFGNK
ncbi:hypothetical protein BDAP_000909 [Binucleata daphniae]